MKAAKTLWHAQPTNVPVEDEDIAKLLRVQDFDVLVSRVFIKDDFIDIIFYEPAISCRPVLVHLSPSLQRREPGIKTHTRTEISTHLYSLVIQDINSIDAGYR